MGIARSASGGYYPTKNKSRRHCGEHKSYIGACSACFDAAHGRGALTRPSPIKEAPTPAAPAPAVVASMFAFEPDPAPAARVWSAQQVAIFDWFKGTTTGKSGIKTPIRGHLVVRARAGCGKTSTILEAINYAPEQRILLAAFNKRIAVELQERLANPNAEAATLHSIGFRCIRRYWERVRVDEARPPHDRATLLARAACGYGAPDPVVRLVAKLHTHAREMAPLATTAGELTALAVAFDCAPDDEWAQDGYDLAYICERAADAMERAAAAQPTTGIDFTDMIYLPIRNKWLRPQYDLVCVDEFQDLNMSQLAIVRGVLKKDGRMCAIGDDAQSIYSWRGAGSDNLDAMKAEMGAAELGLNTTYRCGRRIVAEAAKIVPDIRAMENAHEGAIAEAALDAMIERAAQGDFVLSRVNAPLVRVALALIRNGKRARIEGRDIGAGLRSIARKLATGRAADSMPEWEKKLALWELKEADRAERADVPTKVDLIHDQAATLRALADSATSVREIEARIESLFADTGDGKASYITCSSVHRIKGFEADRVWVLRDTLYPQVSCECGHRHSWGKADCARCACRRYRAERAAAEEERHIVYVAVTRARKELVWVSGK